MNVEAWTTITAGASGPHVTAAQFLLRARGAAIAADGTYGAATTAAVIALQTDVGLAPDGTIGPETWRALVTTTRQGDAGDAVRAVQSYGLLSMPGDAPLVVDGDFGPVTAERVRFHQESWGLTVDGVAGVETWSFLARVNDAWPLVKQGQTQDGNWRVLAAQHLLRHAGASIVADGVFGPASGDAIRTWQQTWRAQFISTTVGQLDWPELIVTVGPGDANAAVSAVQSMLGVTADGVFGPDTEAAVRARQDVFAPPADGVVGPVTWRILVLRAFD